MLFLASRVWYNGVIRIILVCYLCLSRRNDAIPAASSSSLESNFYQYPVCSFGKLKGDRDEKAEWYILTTSALILHPRAFSLEAAALP